MSLRPIPNLSDEAAMAKLGRLSALRSARLDASQAFVQCGQRFQSDRFDPLEVVKEARACLDRIEELTNLERQQ